MIINFNHKGLERLYRKGERGRVQSEYADKIERILARLSVSVEPADMKLPGYRLHKLTGNFAGYWAVSVSYNWRIVFRLEGENVYDVDLIDYH